MKILVINGPNLNFLGIREKGIYGTTDYAGLVKMIEEKGTETGNDISVFQSNHEGAIIDRIQEAYFDGTQGIVINPGAFTHYSYAIRDALASITVPKVEIHISDITQREEFRKISVTKEGSFQAAMRLASMNPEAKIAVMNFANAHRAGGGFELGANAQEEALCRCSTLFASISSAEAKEMYRYNNSHISAVESDYMLLSPEVCVFRDAEGQLMEDNFTAAVITVPAPNKRGAAMFATSKLISETFIRRIRIMLAIAIENGYRNLVLGAWGCGAFGNKPESVAEYFRQVLIDDGYGKCFDNVCFAIYGRTDSRNFTAFNDVFR